MWTPEGRRKRRGGTGFGNRILTSFHRRQESRTGDGFTGTGVQSSTVRPVLEGHTGVESLSTLGQ